MKAQRRDISHKGDTLDSFFGKGLKVVASDERKDLD
jgi:hypothetical protein